MTLIEAIQQGARRLTEAGVAFGHGTQNAFDEAAWLVLWQLGLPLDTPLEGQDSQEKMPLAHADIDKIATLFEARIKTRKPAAYLTREAWLMGVPFYVDERVIVPRSLIAELLFDESLDVWLNPESQRALDLCTGNGSLGVLAALCYPDLQIDASDISADALDVARINIERHQLQQRIALHASDGLSQLSGPYDLILCNPPYVNAQSMAELPPEYLAEPALALDGNTAGSQDGMDFIRTLLQQIPAFLTEQGVLVLEIGNERPHFDAAFPKLHPIWLTTSAGPDQVLLLTRELIGI
jgi:ribosomal protein L3 glutamine methyltransferase